ncbi:hypothetical protein [Sphingomonas melonis]|uniref:Uncharacterized protein n=1 Tax=Sphingomonas melonis TaxID=152682 RepID=A0A7Y9K4R0_9SPHN|nr:hypothetical protein [Sphingomonas melonis]NYD91640.1 hypothetical protein [Sphingomonas melonis]
MSSLSTAIDDDNTAFLRFTRELQGAFVEYGPTVLVALCGIGWAVFRDYLLKPTVPETWPHFLVRLAAVVALSAAGIIGAMLTYKRSGSIRALKSEKSELEKQVEQSQEQLVSLVRNAREAWRHRLAHIAQAMTLPNSFRISIYRYSASTDTFNMLGRYAAIPRYNATGRGVYTADSGCIGAAWESADMESFAENLPADPEEYIKENCENWGFDDETARNLTMKSRSIYAYTVMDAMGIDRIAVIVFESTDTNAANKDDLRKAVTANYRRQLLSDLESLKFIEPSPDLASRKGF